MKIAVVDGQGGGIGYQIIKYLREGLPQETEIIALGTNAIATANMMKAHPNSGASGENAIKYCVNRVDIITGTINIIIPNSMLGELTPEMAEAIILSPAKKILIPLTNQPNLELLNIISQPLPHHIENLIQRIKQLLTADS